MVEQRIRNARVGGSSPLSGTDFSNGWIVLLLSALALQASAGTSFTPAPVIENERVTVWDLTLAEGESGPPTPHEHDAVIMFLEGARIRTIDGHGNSTLNTRKFGDAVFVPKGTDATDKVISGGPAFEIVIALKDFTPPTFTVSADYPKAFPRAGSVMALDEPRFTVWRYDWSAGVPTPMHVHDKDFVVAFRYNATQRLVGPDGSTRTNTVTAGDTFFRERGLTHSEEFPNDPQSALFLELK